MIDQEETDRRAIERLVHNWVVWRDAGDWERFRSVWHVDGWMNATWFQGPAEEFIAVSREGWDRGVSILHALSGCSIDLRGNRAVGQAKMTISQRAVVHDVTCDVLCVGRFFDFFEKRDERWGLVIRQPIYERDRLDPVDPSVILRLDPELLNRFPEGYRHLAYIQTNIGYQVKQGLPGLKGAAVEELYARGVAWLAGKAVTQYADKDSRPAA